jgi:integrase
MDKIAERDGLGHSSLCHARAFLSGSFKEALRKGYLEGYTGAKHEPANPMQNVKVPETPDAETDTYAYSPDEIKALLSVLKDPAWTVVLTAARTGLCKAEIRGLRWQDFDGQTLTVRRSVWNKFENAPKTRHRKAPVPVRKQLADALEMHRLRMGKLAEPDLPIFQGGTGRPLNLDNLVNRVIKPALSRCTVCRKSEEEHKPEGHVFERDTSLPQWHGWHAFRRGVATTLKSLGVDDKDIQGIMRHSDIRLTQNISMKSLSKSRIAAMDTLETDESCNDRATKRIQ